MVFESILNQILSSVQNSTQTLFAMHPHTHKSVAEQNFP